MAAETATAEHLHVLTLDQVRQIMSLADAYKDHLTRTLGADPDADRITEDVQSGGSPAAQALTDAIAGLTRAGREELVALVWCGMGEYSFTEARAYTEATADTGIAQYLAKKAPVLSGLLRTALATFGQKV